MAHVEFWATDPNSGSKITYVVHEERIESFRARGHRIKLLELSCVSAVLAAPERIYQGFRRDYRSSQNAAPSIQSAQFIVGRPCLRPRLIRGIGNQLVLVKSAPQNGKVFAVVVSQPGYVVVDWMWTDDREFESFFDRRVL